MKIAIDIDEVIADFMNPFLNYINCKGNNIKRDQIKTYRIWESLPLSKQEVDDLFSNFYSTEIFGNLPLVDGAKNAIQKIAKDHELIAITSRPESTKKDTLNWINSHFPSVFKEVYFTQKKVIKKADICKELKINFIIEDTLQYAKECNELGTNAILINTPWNQSKNLPDGVCRVDSWKEVLNILSNLST